MKFPYERGCVMSSPVEIRMTEMRGAAQSREHWEDYLLPREAAKVQGAVSEACDSMEYPGSPMYDQYPDRVTIERITDKICGERKKEPLYHALVQMMLCREMGCRREYINNHS